MAASLDHRTQQMDGPPVDEEKIGGRVFCHSAHTHTHTHQCTHACTHKHTHARKEARNCRHVVARNKLTCAPSGVLYVFLQRNKSTYDNMHGYFGLKAILRSTNQPNQLFHKELGHSQSRCVGATTILRTCHKTSSQA